MIGGTTEPLVSILIPHYRTPELARLCLRSLRKFTTAEQVRILVIDNHSNDASLDYLKSLSWITLLEREPVAGETPSQAHARALDLGLSRVETPYVLSFHTDTIVLRHDWLDFLLGKIQAGPDIAGVGSWKLEQKTPLRLLAKRLERIWQSRIWYPLVGKGEGEIEGMGKNYYYLRSHCALYRTALIRSCPDGFSSAGETAGKVLHRKLTDAGYRMLFIPSAELIRYLNHLNHATMILNPGIAGRTTGSRKEYRRIRSALEAANYQAILADEGLDRP